MTATRSPHFSAGVVPVFITDKGEYLFLVLRCYAYWDFPKGGLQGAETPIEAALRELREETTLESVDFRWGDIHRETLPYSKGKVARYYVGIVPTMEVSLPINPELGKPEHHEYRWLPYRDVGALLNPRVREILDWAYGRIF